jgi:hypothetical protein
MNESNIIIMLLVGFAFTFSVINLALTIATRFDMRDLEDSQMRHSSKVGALRTDIHLVESSLERVERNVNFHANSIADLYGMLGSLEEYLNIKYQRKDNNLPKYVKNVKAKISA